MSANLKFKIGFLLLFTSLFLCYVIYLYDSKNLSEAKTSEVFSKTDETTETVSISQLEKIKGQNSFVKFEKDLETSLKIQTAPKVWLEFINENNQTKTVEISKQADEFIQKRWMKTLEYSYAHQSARSQNTKIEINENYLNDAAVLAQKLTKTQIITPSEKRNISQEEAFAVMKIVAKLAIERYKELQNMASQVKSQKISN